MRTTVEGFSLEVTVENGLPRVRVSLKDGQAIVDTDAVSLGGLERLREVFRVAARLAQLELAVEVSRARL